MRSIVTACIFLGLMNTQIKYYLYTSIERKLLSQLTLRVTIALTMLVCIFTSVKYLPLVYVSLSSNLGPLVTALFSYFWIRVPVAKIDIIILIVSFIGVAILITGTVQDPSFVEISSPETAAISSVEGVAIE
jgi:drug/metabolite transporter (DMT)-like permease